MLQQYCLCLLAGLWLALQASSVTIGPVADMHIVNTDISPDGYTRAAVLAGGVFPGPVITGKKGDRFKINVIDDLTNHTMLKTTSIHWHGFFQHGTNWADGGAFVNQCPITSGKSFLYDFAAPGQAGTFWYHSHLSTQYCDGLRGAMVVYDPFDPYKLLYDVDDESTIITLSDWYHTAARLGSPFPFSDSVLINGKGRSKSTLNAELSVVTVQRLKRYRFRLVSLSCDPNFTFSIDGHTMTIIEADGVNTLPLIVDSIKIYAGQRYSFILNTGLKLDNYWIRAVPDIGNTAGTTAGGLNSAILRYAGAPAQEPTTTQGQSRLPLKETNLHPLVNPLAPGKPWKGGADYNLNLALAFNTSTLQFTINGATFIPPTAPVLLQIMSGVQNPQDLLPSGSVFPLPANKVIELSIPAISVGGEHPFHLHGHTFSVVRSADSQVYNYLNPVQRDVVNIGVFDPNSASPNNVTVRFKTDNPGPWLLHCHIDWHFEAGLALVFAEDIPNTAATNPTPDAWKNLCPLYDALADEDK